MQNVQACSAKGGTRTPLVIDNWDNCHFTQMIVSKYPIPDDQYFP